MGSDPLVPDFILQCNGPVWGLMRFGGQEYKDKCLPRKERDNYEWRLVRAKSEESQGVEERKPRTPFAASGSKL